MFAHIINFILFRLACPALHGKHTANSSWHLDNATLSNSSALTYNTRAALKCEAGYWLHDVSSEGKPNTTQMVTCGSSGEWTPAARDCSLISMNFCEIYSKWNMLQRIIRALYILQSIHLFRNISPNTCCSIQRFVFVNTRFTRAIQRFKQ
jgi:hypothetical protein